MITVVLFLIVLHTVDGREIDINPEQITSMREAKPDDASGKYFTSGIRCMISGSDGKFVNVVETCAVVRQKIEERK